jgi:hypothetical protein
MLRKIYQATVPGLIVTLVCIAYVQCLYLAAVGPL